MPGTPANRSGYSPGSAPLPCRLEITPYGTRSGRSSTSILSTSPGSAPRTAIGPVMTCGPGPSCAEVAATAIASVSTLRSGTPYDSKNWRGSWPWSSSTPSWEMVSRVTTSPEETTATGAESRLGSRPQ